MVVSRLTLVLCVKLCGVLVFILRLLNGLKMFLICLLLLLMTLWNIIIFVGLILMMI
mgnify:CR=1 FL=1